MAPEIDERSRMVPSKPPHRGVWGKVSVLRTGPDAFPILGDVIVTRPGRERIVSVAKHLECAQGVEKYDKPDLQDGDPERAFVEEHSDIALGQGPLVVGSRHQDKQPRAVTFHVVMNPVRHLRGVLSDVGRHDHVDVICPIDFSQNSLKLLGVRVLELDPKARRSRFTETDDVDRTLYT